MYNATALIIVFCSFLSLDILKTCFTVVNEGHTQKAQLQILGKCTSYQQWHWLVLLTFALSINILGC